MRNVFKASAFITASLLLAFGAQAHGLDGGISHREMGFFDGLMHPFAGVDHLAAMLAVGLWSATTTRRIWVAPLAFANLLLAGAVLGLSGVTLPAVEPLIAASLLVLGLLLARRQQLSSVVGVLLVGGFALFHGAAHGEVLTASGQWLVPLLGMLLGTVALHLGGLASGLLLRERSLWWSRAAGGLVALLGTVLLAQMV